MSFIRGLIEPENIAQFMSEEKEVLLMYCNHISIFHFVGLRYERVAQSNTEIVYQVYLYEHVAEIREEVEPKLALQIQFDEREATIHVKPQLGEFTAEQNYSMGDGLSFIEESLQTDFFIDWDVQDSDLEWGDLP